MNRFKSFKEYKTETTPCKIKLSSNELPFSLSKQLRERIAKVISEIPFERYPDPTYKELKEVLAQFYGVSPENITVGNGSDELIDILIKAVGNLKSPVMYPVPTFPMYQVSADIINRPKAEFLLDKDFKLDKQKLDEAILKKPHIAFFASPNNPTGNSFDKELIKYTASKNIFTVVDEAYINFSDKESFLKEALEPDNNIVVIRTLSKIGLAGIRLGVLIADEKTVSIIDKIRPPFNITYPTVEIAKIVLTEGKKEIEEKINIVKQERKRVLNKLKTISSVKVFPSDANFYLIKVEDANVVHKKLIEKGILTRNMSHLPNMANCLRVSVGKPEENDAFIEALKEVV
ncbi:MAG: histidinol-phosphate transaminase [Hydrogenothermus sp.]|nr:MAG: histidinol-phosphate transaminase [Hydrogenothermus sp.]